MGLGGISIWQLLIILVIVIAIFGTKRLKDIGSDLGGAVKEFKKGLADGEDTPKLEADKKTADSATQSEKDKSA